MLRWLLCGLKACSVPASCRCIRQLRAKGEELRGEPQKLGEEKMALEARRTGQNQQIQECNDHLLDTEREVARLDQKLSNSEKCRVESWTKQVSRL